MTAVAGSVYTAAQFNQFVRDNLNETAPAKASASSRLIVTSGANQIAEREVLEEFIDAAQTTTSTTFDDLATVGPSVTLDTGNRAVVILTTWAENSTAGGICSMAFEISGTTTSAANDARSVVHESGNAGDVQRASAVSLFSSLTPGSNTFTAKYKVSAGTGTFRRRNLAVLAL
jgi:hypothetical protein